MNQTTSSLILLIPAIFLIVYIGYSGFGGGTKEGMSVSNQYSKEDEQNSRITFKLYEESLKDYPVSASTHIPTQWAVKFQELQSQAADAYNARVMELVAKDAQGPSCRPSVTGAFAVCGPLGANAECYKSFSDNQYDESGRYNVQDRFAFPTN